MACAAHTCVATGNILKRLFVHVGGFNLGLLMRTLIGVGTPRALQGRLGALLGMLVATFHRPLPRSSPSSIGRHTLRRITVSTSRQSACRERF